ncbi:MAG: D-alanyl-D-alanine endopeptidase [Cellvibrionaceae bacterium]
MIVTRLLPLLCGFCLASGAAVAATATVSGDTAAGNTAAPPAKYQNLDVDGVRLGSVKAAVFDPASATMLYSKNADVQAPIASITKLMTAMVVLDAQQPLDEMLTIKKLKPISGKNAYSRIRAESRLSRRDLMQIMLMASENLAAANLAHHFPGGSDAFIAAMNTKAQALGMSQTLFTDASGLSSKNLSTASDIVKMVTAAAQYDTIREFSTASGFTATFENPRYSLHYGNTNRLVHRDSWEIGISKTGYLNDAGRCLVMITQIDGRDVAMVLLDSFGKLTPIGDAGRIKRWLTTGSSGTVAGAALNYERTKSASYR